MIPVNQSVGIFPDSKIALNSNTYIGIMICFVDIMYSLTMSSFPLDLLSFKVLIELYTRYGRKVRRHFSYQKK